MFVETREYRLFHEFCDACRKYRYIGLCYGRPGVGKTLSARHYANWNKVEAYSKNNDGGVVCLSEVFGANVVFYTVAVVTPPNRLGSEIRLLRAKLHAFILEDLYREKKARMAEVYQREKIELDSALQQQGPWHCTDNGAAARRMEALEHLDEEFQPRFDERPDPTQLILIDEADRLRMASLEQVRAIFDQGGLGVVLIGVPGIEKRLSRYAQLYSRIGFVHEFRPLADEEVRGLLGQGWMPPGVALPSNWVSDEEAVAAILRITGGNFRLLERLLTQIARVLEVNNLRRVTPAVVEVARESLVIGTA
jgi:DNA transposition AAA+ family ATPase